MAIGCLCAISPELRELADKWGTYVLFYLMCIALAPMMLGMFIGEKVGWKNDPPDYWKSLDVGFALAIPYYLIVAEIWKYFSD